MEFTKKIMATLGIVKEVRWKEKVIAAVEKGIGRNKVTERSEGRWSEDLERFVIRKMTCNKLREAWGKRRVGVVILN